MISNIIFDSDNTKLIIENLYTIENYVTFDIKIKSGAFYGESPFCLSKETIVSIMNSLEKMSIELSGSCEIRDSDSDAYIIIEMKKLGHLSLYGQIGGSHQDHILKFRSDLDQTILPGLIQILKTALSSEHLKS